MLTKRETDKDPIVVIPGIKTALRAIHYSTALHDLIGLMKLRLERKPPILLYLLISNPIYFGIFLLFLAILIIYAFGGAETRHLYYNIPTLQQDMAVCQRSNHRSFST